jgi:hypothetical protein
MEGISQEKITLRCVREHGKLRIRFHSYTNHDGKEYTNVYNNDYNCQFPRDIREEGKFYEIGTEDLVIVAGGARQPFYRVKKGNIRIVAYNGTVTPAPVSSVKKRSKKSREASETVGSSAAATPAPVVPAQVFEVNECVICLEAKPNQIFLPCAHLCTCSDCYQQMKMNKACCPLCRRYVTSAIVQV